MDMLLVSLMIQKVYERNGQTNSHDVLCDVSTGMNKMKIDNDDFTDLLMVSLVSMEGGDREGLNEKHSQAS